MSSYKTKIIKGHTVKILDTHLKGRGACTGESPEGLGEKNPIQRKWEEKISKIYEEEIPIRERKAFEQGYERGKRETEEKYQQELKKKIAELASIIKEFSMLRHNLIKQTEADIVELSLTMAERILHHEIATQRETICHTLKAAINMMLERDNIIIHLHPEDYRFLMEIKNEFFSQFDGLRNPMFKEDISVSRGGALIITKSGEIDARIDQQFQAMRNTLKSVIDKR